MALFLDGGAGWAPPLLWIQSTKIMHFGGKGVSLPTLPPTTRNPAYYHFYLILVTFQVEWSFSTFLKRHFKKTCASGVSFLSGQAYMVPLSGTYQIDSATDFLMIQQQMLNML